MAYVSLEDKQNYIDQLFERNGIKMSINDIRFDPVGQYLNKIMQIPFGVSGPKTLLVNRK